MQRATLVHRCDAAAARAHRLDQDRRQRDRHTGHRLGALSQRDATADQAGIGAGASHVEREQLADTDRITHEPRAHDAAGGTGQRETGGVLRRLLRRERPTARRHDAQRLHLFPGAQRFGLDEVIGHPRP